MVPVWENRGLRGVRGHSLGKGLLPPGRFGRLSEGSERIPAHVNALTRRRLRLALDRDAGFEPQRQRGAQGHPGLGPFAEEGPDPPCRVPPVPCPPCCEQGPPTLTLLFPLCLPRSLRTQQPPLSIVAYPRPSPSSPLGHQALSDLQAQRDVTAQPLPQLQHGESPGVGGYRLLDPPSTLLHGTAP